MKTLEKFLEKLTNENSSQRKKYISIIIIIFVMIFIGGTIFYKNYKQDEEYNINDIINNNIYEEKNNTVELADTEENSETKEKKQSTEEDKKENNNIFVHICGAVNNPGIVELKNNSRIIDAINAGGGLTANADVSYVNLAYIISDGIKIYIPTVEEIERISFEYLSTECGDNIIENRSFKEKSIVNNVNIYSAKFQININTATESELDSLPGIGPSIANKIILYRNSNGKFNSIDEIKNVSGIGDAKFESIKEFIFID